MKNIVFLLVIFSLIGVTGIMVWNQYSAPKQDDPIDSAPPSFSILAPQEGERWNIGLQESVIWHDPELESDLAQGIEVVYTVRALRVYEDGSSEAVEVVGSRDAKDAENSQWFPAAGCYRYVYGWGCEKNDHSPRKSGKYAPGTYKLVVEKRVDGILDTYAESGIFEWTDDPDKFRGISGRTHTPPFSAASSRDLAIQNKHRLPTSTLSRLNDCERLFSGETEECFRYISVSSEENTAIIMIVNFGGDSASEAEFCMLHEDDRETKCFWGTLEEYSPSGKRLAFSLGEEVAVIDVERGTFEVVFVNETPLRLGRYTGPMGSGGNDIRWIDESRLLVNLFGDKGVLSRYVCEEFWFPEENERCLEDNAVHYSDIVFTKKERSIEIEI